MEEEPYMKNGLYTCPYMQNESLHATVAMCQLLSPCTRLMTITCAGRKEPDSHSYPMQVTFNIC